MRFQDWVLEARRPLLIDVVKSSLSVLARLCARLMSWTAATEETDKRHPAAIIPQGGRLTFQTLDGNTQQVNPDEIWRIRATYASAEPPGAIVSLRPLKKFTLPGGGPSPAPSPESTRIDRRDDLQADMTSTPENGSKPRGDSGPVGLPPPCAAHRVQSLPPIVCQKNKVLAGCKAAV